MHILCYIKQQKNYFTTIFVFALNVSGALAGFWRTMDGMTANGVPNPMEFLFGYGVDENNAFGYGYGYGYGNADFEAGFVVEDEEEITGTSGSFSSGNSGGWGSSNNNSNSDNDTDDTTSDTTDDSNTDDTPTDDSVNTDTPISPNSITYRDYSNQPRLATCGTSIVNFSDISGNTFEDYIIRLEAISGLNGNGNGTDFSIYTPESKVFEPNRSATRSEYVKMILRALCIDYSGENSTLDDFNDGAVDSWQAKVVNKAAELGLINTTNANFRVNDSISRAEALKMVMRAGIDSPFTIVPTTSSFSDVAVWSWESKYTEVAVAAGFIAPNPTFRPGNAITRGESTKFILNALNIQ